MNNQFNKIQTHKKIQKNAYLLWQIQHKKVQKNAYLFWHRHSLHIFGKIPVVKLQNDTETTDKRLKTMTNEREKTYLVLVEFLSLIRSQSFCFRFALIVIMS